MFLPKIFLLVDLKLDGATETNWACEPLVQKLRGLWMKGCGGGAAPQALALSTTPVAVGVCPGSGLLLGSNKGLTVADRDRCAAPCRQSLQVVWWTWNRFLPCPFSTL